jgi:hypothetical protein
VPALHQYDAGTAREDPPGRRVHIVNRSDGKPG